MLRRLKIRTRITVGTVLIALVFTAVAGVVIYDQVQRIVLHGETSVLHAIEAPYVTEIAAEPPVQVDEPGPGQLAAVVDPNGTIVIDSLPPALGVKIDDLIAGGNGLSTVGAGGDDYLLRITPVQGADGIWHVIAARHAATQAAVLDQLAVVLIVSFLLINLGFGAASWAISTVALAPVGRLRRSAAELAARPGDDLLSVGRADDEIAALARELNSLIARLRESLDRERQMVSNASHEIRTPLAILQAQLELAGSGDASRERIEEDLEAARATLARLSALTTALLELSRLDARSEPGTATWAALADELADAVERSRRRFRDTRATIDYELSTTADAERIVQLSASELDRIVENLIANAVVAAGGNDVHVDLAWTQTPTEARLTVRDDAGGMNPAFVPAAFQRFTRGPGAPDGGSGLGLAIVSGIAAVAGGTARLDNEPDVGLTVVVTIPLRPVPAPAV
ncbi:sensor histidine kinase [Agromyces sp. NPDC057865]|uniref:sensor histidine kinase n=1 Tax=Agromyces sp. NPDC057865 TaxID=3346267 RepID=UPI00366F1816